MESLDKTLASIREQRDVLSEIDNSLSAAITCVEQALRSLKFGIPVKIDYAVDSCHQSLSFQKHNGSWQLMWSRDPHTQQSPLLAASRKTRAEVFAIFDGQAPIEALIYRISSTIAETAESRKDLVARAQALIKAFEQVLSQEPT